MTVNNKIEKSNYSYRK